MDWTEQDWKAELDALEAAGVYPDDDQIDVLKITRHKPGKPCRVEVTLELLSNDTEEVA